MNPRCSVTVKIDLDALCPGFTLRLEAFCVYHWLQCNNRITSSMMRTPHQRSHSTSRWTGSNSTSTTPLACLLMTRRVFDYNLSDVMKATKTKHANSYIFNVVSRIYVFNRSSCEVIYF